MAKLTAKQKRFVDEYLVDLNATQAAIRAGYSPKSARAIGQENLTKPVIKTHIEETLKQIEDERIAAAAEVMKYLTAVMRGEHTEECLKLVGDGVQTIATIDVGAKERLKAAELLGKRYGLFTDKVNIEGQVPVVICGEDDLED